METQAGCSSTSGDPIRRPSADTIPKRFGNTNSVEKRARLLVRLGYDLGIYTALRIVLRRSTGGMRLRSFAAMRILYRMAVALPTVPSPMPTDCKQERRLVVQPSVA